jgi:hypothetical protein
MKGGSSMNWEWLLERSRPVFDGFVKLEPRKWGPIGTTLELAAETGKLARAITIFEGYRHGRKSRHDMADELSDILFVLCRLVYDNDLNVSGQVSYEHFGSPEAAFFYINHNIQRIYDELCFSKGDVTLNVGGVASGVRWLAGHYGIDLQFAHEQEMLLASAFQRIYFTAEGKKKSGNLLLKFFRKVIWVRAVKRHEKALNEH